MVARRNWTVQWWESQQDYYELVTSVAVIDELKQGNHPNKDETLKLIEPLPFD